MFYRLTTDGLSKAVNLQDQWAGPTRTSCWIIGGGPSLNELPTELIAASPAPKFAINLSGQGVLRPTFWTSYDPTVRFQQSLYLDASITKFVHRCRAMDLIPESSHKVCDAPALYFFDRVPQRGFHDFPGGGSDRATQNQDCPAQTREPTGVTDWQDSLIQAIEIAYHLGFRRLFLAGCEMFIPPTALHLRLADSVGVEYRHQEPLKDFFDRCRQAGLSAEEFDQTDLPGQYHFAETKPFAAAVQTDYHYFRVAQYLRLSRRSLALAGLELVSVTPVSRLNDHFPCCDVETASQDILSTAGDPSQERATGRYTRPVRQFARELTPMRDFSPHNWSRKTTAADPAVPAEDVHHHDKHKARLRAALADLPEVAVRLDG
ncbi:MAG: hypothetical protein ACK5Q5_20000 [Planctomycetaceae bacterium]